MHSKDALRYAGRPPHPSTREHPLGGGCVTAMLHVRTVGVSGGAEGPAFKSMDPFISRNEKKIRECLSRSSMLTLRVL